MRDRLTSIVNHRAFPLIPLLLTAVRFVAPSVIAFLGVEGVDTSGVDAFFAAYDRLLPAIASLLVALVITVWPGGFGRDPILAALGVLIAWDVLFWAAEVDPRYRLVWGPWASLPLGLGVSATTLACGLAFEARLRRAGCPSPWITGFRALYTGFGAALLLGALRVVDYQTALGAAPPSGWTWLLNYGGILIMSGIAVYYWIRVGLPEAKGVGPLVGLLAPPLLGALVGIVVSQGLGGFIVANTLAWGGGYEVFIPTAVSLGLVGFAAGGFLATSWVLRRRLTRRAWRWGTCGVSTVAFAGMLPFGGALASLAGTLLGLTCVARGLSDEEQAIPGRVLTGNDASGRVGQRI